MKSEPNEMLDSETEPCLMMENILEDGTTMDSHTHNMISSMSIASQHEQQDDSLHNLCEAIANRRKIEEQTNLMLNTKSNSLFQNGSSVSICEQQQQQQALIDHVINVDNLVTKLLKVLRIIQMDNDNCIQRLITEK